MQEEVRRYAEEVRRSNDLLIQIRVGLNSGEAVGTARAHARQIKVPPRYLEQGDRPEPRLQGKINRTAAPGRFYAPLTWCRDGISVRARRRQTFTTKICTHLPTFAMQDSSQLLQVSETLR